MIVHIYPNFTNYGGAQKILIDIANNLNKDKTQIIIGFNRKHQINPGYLFSNNVYYSTNILNIFKADKILSHSRLTTSILKLISVFYLVNKTKIIHVHHNVFEDKKMFSLFPEKIIAVSNAAKLNLINFFNIEENKIKVILNGIEDPINIKKDNKIDDIKFKPKIIYPGRITPIKGQLKFLDFYLKNNFSFDLDFAGVGEEYLKLKLKLKKIENVNAIGHVNINIIFPKYNFTFLLSSKEGLPITLIESCANGIPCLVYNVGGNNEIIKNGVNGYIINNQNEIPEIINKINCLNASDWQKLSNNSRRIFESRFTLNRMIAEYQKFIFE